jgi:hypothetical protein
MGFPNSGAMLRAPMDTKQIQLVAAEIYRVPLEWTGFLSIFNDKTRWLR